MPLRQFHPIRHVLKVSLIRRQEYCDITVKLPLSSVSTQEDFATDLAND
jgi:hypothetical protein